MNEVWIFANWFEQGMNSVWIWTLIEHCLNGLWLKYEFCVQTLFMPTLVRSTQNVDKTPRHKLASEERVRTTGKFGWDIFRQSQGGRKERAELSQSSDLGNHGEIGLVSGFRRDPTLRQRCASKDSFSLQTEVKHPLSALFVVYVSLGLTALSRTRSGCWDVGYSAFLWRLDWRAHDADAIYIAERDKGGASAPAKSTNSASALCSSLLAFRLFGACYPLMLKVSDYRMPWHAGDTSS